MSEERARILQMVSEGRIDAQQGVELLEALKTAKTPDGTGPQLTANKKANWFRVRVTNMETGRPQVNVNLPFSLVRAGIKFGARFAPEAQDIDWDELIQAIDDGAVGKLVDVEDLESGEKVEIFVE